MYPKIFDKSLNWHTYHCNTSQLDSQHWIQIVILFWKLAANYFIFYWILLVVGFPYHLFKFPTRSKIDRIWWKVCAWRTCTVFNLFFQRFSTLLFRGYLSIIYRAMATNVCKAIWTRLFCASSGRGANPHNSELPRARKIKLDDLMWFDVVLQNI